MPYLVYAYHGLSQTPKAFEMQKTCEVERPEMQASLQEGCRRRLSGHVACDRETGRARAFGDWYAMAEEIERGHENVYVTNVYG